MDRVRVSFRARESVGVPGTTRQPSFMINKSEWLLLRCCNLSNIGDRVRNISSNAENNPNTNPNPNIYTMECRWGAHLPSFGREPVGGYTTEVCDAWPVRCQTYGYLPSRRASPPLDLVLLWPYICAGSEMKPKLF